MAKLTEIERWEEEIYRIEENDPVHGGENGITNKPTKQLANRTLFLRKQLQLAGQKLVPKKLTSTTRNLADETGHTHEIERGDTTKAGLMQLTNDTGLESENLGLSVKGGKAIAQSVAQLQQRLNDGLNQKVNKTDISDAANSESRTSVASSKAVKAAYDKATAAEALAQTKQSALVRHRLDLTALDAERYHLVTLTPGSGQTTEGSRWQFQIMRSFSGLGRVAWATHRDGVFSLQLGWSSNRSSWGANAVYRTIEMFEYAWTTQSPVMNIGQLEADSIEYVYLRGGSIYFADAPEGFRVEMQAADFTRNNVTLAASMPFDAARVPLVDIKQAREVVQEAVRQKSLSAIIPNSTVRWDRALPNELPVGTVVGTGQRSQLNLNDDTYTGWQMVSRLDESNLSVRFGLNAGRFFYQQAKNASEWGEAIEVMGARRLSVENLNYITNIGFYGQNLNVNATTDRNYPVGLAGSLVVMPSAYGVMQEYTTFSTGNKYVRGRDGNGWLPWRKLLREDDLPMLPDDSTNLCLDPTMLNPKFGFSWTGGSSELINGKDMRVISARDNFYLRPIKVEAGERFYVSCLYSRKQGSANLGIGLHLDRGKSSVAFISGGSTSTAQDTQVSASGGIYTSGSITIGVGGRGNGASNISPTLSRLEGYVDIPVGVSSAELWLQIDQPHGVNTTQYYVTDVEWRRVPGKLVSQSDFNRKRIGNFDVTKYPDGTMIQTFSYEENDLTVWSEKAFSWAAAFVERPMMFAQITTSYGGGHDCGVNILTKSTSGRVFYHYYEHEGLNQGLCLVQFLAIGRWK